MGYKRYKMLQKYVNGVATEEYKQGDLISDSEYSTYDVCMEGNEKPDVPVIDTIYQWVNDGTTCDGWSKYKLEKQQKSTDGGVTWTDTGATRKGNLIASCSDDCGAEITAKSISNCSYDITASSLTKQWGSSICVNLDITLRNATGVKTFITTIRNKDKTGSTVDWINYETISTQGGNIWCFELNKITEDKECEIVWRIDDKYTLVQDLKVKTNQRDYSSEYMTFEAVKDGAYLKFVPDHNSGAHGYFKINDGEWNYKSAGEIATNLKSGDKIFVKSDITYLEDTGTGKHRIFDIYGLVVYGNIMSLVYGDDFIGKTTIYDSNFQILFAYSGLISAENLILPATTLKRYCYENMFLYCTSLTQAPVLPATTLAYGCYETMFADCTSLTTAPELPATTLAEVCYWGMFEGCTSLTTAPVLPATTLNTYCYFDMFRDCTSLTQAPVLPATTLAEDCYVGMFSGCTNLIYLKCLAVTIDHSNYRSWLDGIETEGTFVKIHGVGYNTREIPNTWTVIEI